MKPFNKSAGELQTKINEVLEWLNQNEIKIFWGIFESDIDTSKIEVVRWNKEIDENWKPFLELAKENDCKMVILSLDVFYLDQVLKQVGSDEVDDEDRDRIKILLKQLSDKDNQIYRFVIRWVKLPFVYDYSFEANWVSDYEELIEILPDHEPYHEIRDIAEEEIIKTEAIKVANDEKFQLAKNKDQRIYAAKQVVDKQVLNERPFMYKLRSIVEQAQTIYELEIRPNKEHELAEKINELLKIGFSKAEISKKLKINIRQLNKFL